jgi:hypothetical protein
MSANKEITLPGQGLATIAGIGLLCGIAMTSVQGCDDGPLGDIAEQCGLVCPGEGEGLVAGNFAISGIASIDGFFSAVVNVRSAALQVSGTVRAELEGMAASLGIEGAAELSLADLTAQVRAGIEAKISANVQGSLTIKFEPAKCEADLEVTAKAAAECDVEADPGSIEAKCEGSCEVSAEVAAECSAMGTLSCSGQAPNFECEGSCTGSCQLEVAAECGGSCNGECEGECSACAGGACDNQGGVVANCAGSCGGMCRGECKLEAGGSCGGRCEGSCEYTPPSGMCEANATAKCDVSAMADAKCEGKCEGSVEPPMVKAECSAQVEAKAKAEIVCTPPSLSVEFQFAAGLDADAQAEFKAWLEGFKARFAGMLAARAKLDFVAEAAVDLIAAGEGAVRASFDTALSGDLDLKASIGIGCALGELEAVGTVLGEAQAELTASATAFVEIGGAVGAG